MTESEIFTLVATVIAAGGAAYFGAYLKEKGKSTASKEDAKKITRMIEEVKRDIQERDRIASTKYQLKYEACLNALGILDAHLSHKMKNDNNGKPINVDKQFSTPEETRKCHNDLLLTLENQEIVRLFASMLTGGSSNLMKDLDKFRQLLRVELGFGEEEMFADGKKTWMANIASKKGS